MSYTLGVVFFVVALLTSVMLHEAGHFLTAKHFGMKATRFFVGFGPTLWSTMRGETEYGVKAIPAGGFVKIVGMTPLEEVEPGDEDRVFFRQPLGQRLVVLSAGSFVHFVLAIGLVFLVIATIGDPVHGVATLTVDSVTKCATADGTCHAGDKPAPAYGQLKAGDRVVAFDGVPVATWEALRADIQSHPGVPVVLGLVRNHAHVDVTLTPIASTANGKTIGRVGVVPRQIAEPISVAAAVPRTFTTLGSLMSSTVHALGGLPHQVSQIIDNKPRSPNGAAGVVDIARVSGQIAQAHQSFGLRLANLVFIVAELNFFVGVFNMLPLLPLDGGHVGIALFEAARSRVYRALGRRDPGRVDLMKVIPVTYAVVAAFVGLSLLMLYAGVVNPIRIQ